MSLVSNDLPGALLRFRVMSVLTGVAVILLFFVAVPIGNTTFSHIVGDGHGWFLFPLYLAASWDLVWRRLHWVWWQCALTAAAGTIPFCSFVAERVVSKRMAQPVAATLDA